MGLFKSYSTPGPGVDKTRPKKRGFFRFFEVYFRKFWKMFELNLITALMCLPVVTIGPAIAGMTKVLRSYSMEKSIFMMHEFWKGFTQNWKQSLPVGLLNLLVTASVFLGLDIYPKLADEYNNNLFTVLAVITVSVGCTLLMMNFYISLMIVATDLKLKDILKNSFFLVCIDLKRSLLTLVITLVLTAAMVVGILLNLMWIFLVPTLFLSFVGFIIVFNSYPVIQKHVIDPFYAARNQENPEHVDFTADDNSIFSDKLDLTDSAAPKTKGKQKKTIS
ncbi:MAG: DUF624 domain-containing protein [Ruminococcus sp.]|nr:DUF624 domain-containing protein [Ruminococcus sp.]